MGRALLAQQVEELLDEARDAGQDDPVPTDDRGTRRVMSPEELVGRVDQVDLHRSARLPAG